MYYSEAQFFISFVPLFIFTLSQILLIYKCFVFSEYFGSIQVLFKDYLKEACWSVVPEFTGLLPFPFFSMIIHIYLIFGPTFHTLLIILTTFLSPNVCEVIGSRLLPLFFLVALLWLWCKNKYFPNLGVLVLHFAWCSVEVNNSQCLWMLHEFAYLCLLAI